jgi:antitoxin CptB
MDLKMTETVNKSKLLWACRRGMLELDVLFMPFAQEVFDNLSEVDKFTFERLLSCDDPDLFSWFMGHKVCEDEALAEMVRVILKRGKA